MVTRATLSSIKVKAQFYALSTGTAKDLNVVLAVELLQDSAGHLEQSIERHWTVAP